MRQTYLYRCALSAVIAFAGGTGNALAADWSDRFNVFGFGYQEYAQTDDNQYLGADSRGTWDINFLGLVVSATVDDRSKVWAQVEATTDEGTRFTWFFIDRQITNDLRVHVGRVKYPLGLYNETIDAKSLHVSQLEPMLYQTATDMVHDAYHGVGIDYDQDVGAGHLTWQVYAGNSYDLDPPVDSRDRRAFGGRVTYRTPVDGLRVMLSAYRTHVEELATGALVNEDRQIASVDYTCSVCDIKAEYARHRFFGVSSHAYYVQAGYALTSEWSPYVRYDRYVADEDRSGDPSFYQDDVVVGVTYRVTDAINIRLENHFNHGYAVPVATAEVPEGQGSVNWNLVVAAVNFTF